MTEAQAVGYRAAFGEDPVTMMLVGAGVAVATGDDPDVLQACAKTRNGQMRLVNDRDDCRRSENFVQWASQVAQAWAQSDPLADSARTLGVVK